MTLCDQLGLDLGIAGSPGWSETGGPWVSPREAMKKYVWSETEVEGGTPFSGKLAHPPTVTGLFQNTPVEESRIGHPEFNADGAVVAFRTPQDERAAERGKFSSSGGAVTEEALSDQNASTSVVLKKAGEAGTPWLLAAYAQPVTMRSVTLSLGRDGRGVPMDGVLEASDDGSEFRPVLIVPRGGAMV